MKAPKRKKLNRNQAIADLRHSVPWKYSKNYGFIWIYGLYSKTGECLYIGQTTNFRERECSHNSPPKKSPVNGVDFIMLPIAKVEEHLANEKEREYQFTMERGGQAKLSNRHWKKPADLIVKNN